MLRSNTGTPSDYGQNLIDIVPQAYGAYLKHLRGQARPKISQVALVKKMVELSGKPFGRSQLSRIESDELYPTLEQVALIFRSLRELNAPISASERDWYLTLAQRRIASKGTHLDRENTPAKWQTIARELETYERDATFPVPVTTTTLSATKRQGQELETTFADIRHVIGRQAWVEQMLGLLLAPPLPVKLYVLQASLGSGKSSALHVLGWILRQMHPDVRVLLVELPDRGDEQTQKYLPEEYLDLFAGAVLTGLGQVGGSEKKKHQEREERIEMVLSALSKKRTVVLMDNAEAIFEQNGIISASWDTFLNRYLRHPHHQATLVVATEEWPGWYGEASYVHEAFLPALRAEDGVTLLGRMGLAMVSQEILEQASARVHHHPGALGWLAKLVKKRAYSVAWTQAPARSGEALSFLPQKRQEHSEEDISKEERALRHILQEPQIFRGSTASSMLQPILRRMVDKRVSQEALELLEVLAASPIPLHPEALEAVLGAEQVSEHLAELQRASLLVASEQRYQLQPLAAAAGYHRTTALRRSTVEAQLEHIYRAWMQLGEFTDEREQGLVVTELVFLLLKHEHLLEAAQLLVHYGWLSFELGHGVALARHAMEVLRRSDWRAALEDECGGLLLKVYLGRYLGEDLAAADRKQAYLRLYEVMHEEKIPFQPGAIQYIVHHKLRYFTAQDLYAEALDIIEEECRRHKTLQDREPVIYAELTDRKAVVLGSWGDFLAGKPEYEEEAFRLRKEAADLHLQCIESLHRYERHTSPLERSRIRLKRARYLNDASYYLRKTSQLEQAQKAMQACLEIKEAGLAVPSSLATSYDDYGELLAQLGDFREAERYSGQALHMTEKRIEEGASLAHREKGMMMINRAKLLLQLGQLDEAKTLCQGGILLVEGTSRRYKIPEAEAVLQCIDEWHHANPRHQLDWRWYPQYQQLVAYSDVKWLTQTGPFTTEEQKEVNKLLEHYDGKVADKRLSTLIADSRQRELTRCLQEEREPQFHYPLIPLNDVQLRIEKLSLLRTEVEEEELNALVRTLYLGAIDEQLTTLSMISAAGKQDDNAFQLYNARLNPLPTDAEMDVAVRQVIDPVQKGLASAESYIRDLSEKLAGQLRHWRLMPRTMTHLDVHEAQGAEPSPVTSTHPQKLFAPSVIEQFFYDVFRTYGFEDWTVVRDPASDHASVSLTLKRVTLPVAQQVSSTKIRDLLGHEVETHVFRSAAGAKSPLALLSSGLSGFLDTEEGLALCYEQQIAQYMSEAKSRFWIGTLATGLAAGVHCPALTFRQLLSFVEDLMVLKTFLSGKNKTITEMREEARAFAIRRCLRTYRGVSHLEETGVCSTKDANYFRGFTLVSQKIQHDAAAFDRLMCGSVGLHHLPSLAELGIIKPAITHLRLAIDPHLDERILQFAE